MRTQRLIIFHRRMTGCQAQGHNVLLVAILTWLSAAPGVSNGQPVRIGGPTNTIRIEQIERGVVEVLTPGSTIWVPTTTNMTLGPNFRVRTGLNTRATLRWSDESVVPMNALTELEILPPDDPKSLFGLNLLKGIISFFHRDEPGRIRVLTRGAAAGIKGTEFVVEIDTSGPVERTRLSVIDGRVQFYNEHGSQDLTNNQESMAEVGQAPSPPVGFIANNRLQWCFYYPGILDLQDLSLAPAEEAALAESLRAYRQGDLLAALRLATGQPLGSDAARLYFAALLLSVGRVADTEAALSALPSVPPTDRIPRLAAALRLLIAAVKRDPNASTFNPPPATAPPLSTELLAASYYEQSLAVREKSLEAALKLARAAVTNSPNFGFGWERVAELEFSFGRIDRAEEAFEKSYALSSRNAEALSLEGFLLAAQNKTRQALDWFHYAINADSSLGNAWLGRGLCRIRKGDLEGGRGDLLIAAALEPQRALLRSYLGKAYGEDGDYPRAVKELDRAKHLDPKDPTSWLYSALLNHQYNRVNEAIRDLEYSQELNDNRSVYRSGLLLDEDRAVRSANLAAIYRDAGMFDVSVREASKAVTYDYANYSAHLFLANSFGELRDPGLINLRYEAPAETEYLLANLLAPVGAGTLSPAVSQQEYSKLFQRDGVGLISDTEYLSRGAWTESGAQYGTFEKFSYSVDAFYHSDRGQRANNDTEQRQLSIQIKDQLSAKDSIFFRALQYDATSGDLTQYFDQAEANSGVRVHERQEPILALGYHREWSPGVHTLFLAARLQDTLSLTNPVELALLSTISFGSLAGIRGLNIQQDFKNDLEIYSTELQQIWERGDHNTIIGARVQWGNFQTRNLQTDPKDLVNAFPDPPAPAAEQDLSVNFKRFTAYAYEHWQIASVLQLIGGVSYDRITFPQNFRFAPISDEEQTVSRFSPKAGIILAPAKNSVIRFAFARSLTGASLDQSFQLEPSQIGGFVQSYRSIIPESVSGPNSGEKLETFGLSLEQRLESGTYVALTGEILNSHVKRTVGVFQWDFFSGLPANAAGLAEHLDYKERSLTFTVNQLVGQHWSLGALYRIAESKLADEFPDAQNLAPFSYSLFTPSQKTRSLLHQADLFVIYNHPSGLFAQFDALWYHQHNQSDIAALTGNDFWQLNALAGYRSPGRRFQVTMGLLNIAAHNYQLNPLTPYNDLPRGRTLALRFLLNF